MSLEFKNFALSKKNFKKSFKKSESNKVDKDEEDESSLSDSDTDMSVSDIRTGIKNKKYNDYTPEHAEVLEDRREYFLKNRDSLHLPG